MYTKSAHLYDQLYHFKDYAAEAAEIRRHIRGRRPGAVRLLDVACGTGRHIELLSAWYDVAGLELNEGLLAIARQRCPGAALHRGDMADFTLGETFDVITCLFGSIAYFKTEERLRATLRALRAHLAPGGMVLVEPFFTPDAYWTGTITANYLDEPETKIAWMYASDPPEDGVAALEIHYLVGTRAGVDHFTERHEFGLFTDAHYRDAIEAVGLAVENESRRPFGRGLYIGVDDGSGDGPS